MSLTPMSGIADICLVRPQQGSGTKSQSLEQAMSLRATQYFGAHPINNPAEPLIDHNRLLDILEVVKIHEDGSYELRIDADEFARLGESDQWYGYPATVVEHIDTDDFLSINSREQAEEIAEKIAYLANREIYYHAFVNPDVPVDEQIREAYDRDYPHDDVPAFTVEVIGRADRVDVGELVQYWKEEREIDF